MPEELDELVARLNLIPHPEGGFYRETYRAPESIAAAALPDRFTGDRAHATAIYYLLAGGDRSKLHRIHADEIWHFYAGDPLLIVAIAPDGGLSETMLGCDLALGQVPQHVVPAGHWFGAVPAAGSTYALTGCTVAPGFDFADFEMGTRDALLATFPQHRDWIEKLTD